MKKTLKIILIVVPLIVVVFFFGFAILYTNAVTYEMNEKISCKIILILDLISYLGEIRF